MRLANRLLFISLLLILIQYICSSCTWNEENGKKLLPSTDAEPLTLPIVNKPLALSCFWINQLEVNNYNEVKCFRELEARTGIKIQWIHPDGSHKEQLERLTMMFASHNLPDLIYIDWNGQNVPQLVSDGSIIRLNELIDRYAPNYKKAMDEHPSWRKQVTLDDGTHYKFAYLLPQPMYNSGFMIRKDWLNNLGLKEPVTIDEWHDVLKAFKEKDANGNGDPDDEIPFSATGKSNLYNFALSWGVCHGFYQENGKVVYGDIQPSFKDYLATMRQWYKEGLIDPDYAATDPSTLDFKINKNIVGAWYGSLGNNMGRYLDTMRVNYPLLEIAGLPQPKGSNGVCFGASEYDANPKGYGMALTNKNTHLKESVKWLDYFYTPDGQLLMTFGIEGESYSMQNNSPKYTPLILNNTDGLSTSQILGRYCLQPSHGPFIAHPLAYPQLLKYPEQQEAYRLWTQEWQARSSCPVKRLPSLHLTPEESERFVKIMNEISSYVGYMFDKFIMGQESIEAFDAYVQHIKELGIDEAIAIQQSALERYNMK